MYIKYTMPDSGQLSSKKRLRTERTMIIGDLPDEPGHDTTKFTDIANP